LLGRPVAPIAHPLPGAPGFAGKPTLIHSVALGNLLLGKTKTLRLVGKPTRDFHTLALDAGEALAIGTFNAHLHTPYCGYTI
jgi:hypothetical protein|tara:strand:+ start:939 stop:1184 length:246 start_codon:yes stop_codon:yes gene_type:complete